MAGLNRVSLYTDGGSRGNPGHAGIGIVIKDGNAVIEEHGDYIGKTTNNQAEYQALVRGLDMASKHTSSVVRVFMDSELIVKQLTGEYRMKEPTLFPLQREVFKHMKKFDNVIFKHILRAENSHADELVNRAIDSVLKK